MLRDAQRRRSYDAVIGAALSTDADASLVSQVRVAGGSADRPARTLVGLLRAAIVLAVAASAMFPLVALLEGH